jgi:hypothetical protein
MLNIGLQAIEQYYRVVDIVMVIGEILHSYGHSILAQNSIVGHFCYSYGHMVLTITELLDTVTVTYCQSCNRV